MWKLLNIISSVTGRNSNDMVGKLPQRKGGSRAALNDGRKVLMVLFDNYYPQDLRVRKEIKTLLREGFRIYLIARNKGDQPKVERRGGLEIFRVSLPFEGREGRIYGIMYYLVLRHAALLQILKLRLKGVKFDLTHVHDLPSALSSLIMSKLLRKPVVVDFHEDWPELVLLYERYRKSKISKTLIRVLYKILKLEEFLILKWADGIIVVSEEFKNLLVRRGRNRPIAVVHNTVDLEEMKQIEARINVPEDMINSDRRKLVYVGGVTPNRALDVVVKGLSMIPEEKRPVLYVVGDGQSRPSLERITEELGLGKWVKFTGWLPFEEAMGYVKGSDICLLPLRDYPEAHIAFPNKLQQYMYFSKPIAAANVRSLRRIISQCGCGFLYSPEDPEDFASKYMNNLDKLKEMGEKGAYFVRNVLNWRVSSENLLRLYGNILLGSP